VFGALTLNHSVGGLNPVAVEIAGRSGCKIVWMPTVDARTKQPDVQVAARRKAFWPAFNASWRPRAFHRHPDRRRSAGEVTDAARRCMERSRTTT
jgi:hypothetical protein